MEKRIGRPGSEEASRKSGLTVAAEGRNKGLAPLYQRVALWGWRLGQPFCRDDVASAFGIGADSAGDVMSYLCRARPDVVESRQYYARGDGRSRKRFLHILSSPNVDGKAVKATPVHLAGVEKGGLLLAMRRRFIRGEAEVRGRGRDE